MTAPDPRTKSDGRNVLTHSRMQSYKTCQRKHYFEYELGIRRSITARPLRFGSAFHVGLDLKAQGKTQQDAINGATADYRDFPAWCNTEELETKWRVEAETCRALLAGYFWRWQDDDIKVVETEQSFNLPIINPETGKQTQSFRKAGKIDKIIVVGDGTSAIMEHKTAGVDISPESDYWGKLRIDTQISQYMLAAREMGYPVDTVLYDVAHKPSIKPRKLTKAEAKVFGVDAVWFGVEFYGIGIPARETPEMFGARVLHDIGERPDFYFARKEIPRLESDLAEYATELWQIQRQIRESQKDNRWFRNTGQCTIFGRCPYADLCFQGVAADGEVPQGYTRLTNIHPEL